MAWKERVLEDAGERPFQAEELEKASEQARISYESGERLEKAYGCTLVLAMITNSYWFGLQIGDGKCVSAYSDGVFIEPVQVDEENCLGNRSTSLCNSNAPELFRHYYSEILPVAVFVVSDGVEESFDQMGLYNYFYSIMYWVTTDGIEATKMKLDDLLPQVSEGGSGDDVSLSAFICTDMPLAKPKQALEQVYEQTKACKDVVTQCDDMLEKANDAKNGYEKIIKEKESEIFELEEKLTHLRTDIEESREVYARKQSEIDDLLQKKDKVAEQLDKVTKYKESAMMFWREKYRELNLHFVSDDEVGPETKITEDNYIGTDDDTVLKESDQVNAEKHAAEVLLACTGGEPMKEQYVNLVKTVSEGEPGEINYKDLNFDELINIYKTLAASGNEGKLNGAGNVDNKKGWSIFKRGTKK